MTSTSRSFTPASTKLQYPHANSDEMTTPTPLRILRTFFLHNNRATIFSIRAPAHVVVAPQRHVQPCPLRTRTFATSPSLRAAAKRQTALGVEPQWQCNNPHIISPTYRSLSSLSPTAANPPATTRPPPLELPPRDPETSTFSHLFRTGKAYLAFYKTGLKNIYLNTRLVWSLDSAGGIPTDTPSSASQAARPPVKRVPEHGSTTRSRELLKRRWSHDVRRLPLFALVLLICGEFTPFVVFALPRAVPFTCRIPRQVEGLQRKAEERRHVSFARLAEARKKQQVQIHEESSTKQGQGKKGAQTSPRSDSKEAIAHIARSLNLVSPLWDQLGLPDAVIASPFLAGRKVRAHLTFLEEDTRLLRQAGGVDALEDAEVVLACADRGIDALNVEVSQLRSQLREWMNRAQGGGRVSVDKIMASLVNG